MSTSGWTIARALRRLRVAEQRSPRVLGVADWAIRRGQRYGTILVDLEAGHGVDVLPDREADSVAAWLRAHPVVTVAALNAAHRRLFRSLTAGICSTIWAWPSPTCWGVISGS